MKFVLFSDIHCRADLCVPIVEKSKRADVAIGAGDFASFRHGLPELLAVLSQITIPTILVPGNHESKSELIDCCRGVANFHVLHGDAIRIHGLDFVGLGCGIPETPFGSWSVDISDQEAWSRLPRINERCVLVTHSPPHGCLDRMSLEGHVGSKSIRRYIQQRKPYFAVCGHIHENWHQMDWIDGIPVINAGPFGYEFEPACERIPSRSL